MTHQSIVDKNYWVTKNPDIKFHSVKKAFYGTHLLKATVHICGASIRYCNNRQAYNERMAGPTFIEFMDFLKGHVVRFNYQKLSKIVDNRFIHVTRSYGRVTPIRFRHLNDVTRIYDSHTLYAFYKMIREKPPGIRFSRIEDSVHIYSNNINDIEEVINQLQIPSHNIISITSPLSQDIEALLSGKEFSNKADKFKYKVFLKASYGNPAPALANYLESIRDSDEIEVPVHCKMAVESAEERWSWRNSQRSYLYVKNEDMILLIKLLAGNRYSDCIELILPTVDLDK